MKEEKREEGYQTPHVDVTKVAVEVGFASSPGNNETTDIDTDNTGNVPEED
jgi:hypothetical protein